MYVHLDNEGTHFNKPEQFFHDCFPEHFLGCEQRKLIWITNLGKYEKLGKQLRTLFHIVYKATKAIFLV